MRKKQFKTQEEFLLDMLQYYCVNPQKRRRSTDTNLCQYAPAQKTSEGCAIGRHLSKSLAISLDKLECTIDNFEKDYPDWFQKIPKWLRNLGIDFLQSCQSFHDLELNWNTKGLTKTGKEQLLKIIITYKMNKELFSKYLAKNAK